MTLIKNEIMTGINTLILKFSILYTSSYLIKYVYARVYFILLRTLSQVFLSFRTNTAANC